MAKLGCNKKRKITAALVVRKYTSWKSQGSHKVENETRFDVRIYVDISQSVTACLLGTRLISQILGPRPQYE